MDYEVKTPPKLEVICKKKIHDWFKAKKINPFGNFRDSGKGFEIWGTKKVKGIDVNNLYYVDEEEISKWRGQLNGWCVLVKEEIKPKVKKRKKINSANKQMQEARMRARLSK